ncbi:SCO7613 C-terminal domain-containing membrane protein, partial [Streptomyces sp. NPDC059456]
VTLLGAHRRLQAPLLLGGATLAAVAVHELAPYVVQVVDALPRWLPPALAGLLLLVVGATYEKRLRDARRLRAALGRLG